MKLVWLSLVLALMCVSCYGLDREAFTFTKYDLDVRLEPEQQRLGVRGKITLRNDSRSPQRSLSLQISGSLRWRSITFAGKPVEFLTQTYTSDIDHTGALSEAIVVLPQPVAPKQSVELEIGYEGVIPQDTSRLTRIGVPEDQAKRADWDQIGRAFTAVRGIGYVAWYPIATDAVSLADADAVPESAARWKQRELQTKFEVNLCVVQESAGPGMAALMNDASEAKAIGDSDVAGCRMHLYDPLVTTVPVFAVADYSSSNQPDADIYFLPDHKSSVDDYASAVNEVSPLITKWFGDHRENSSYKSQALDLPDPQASSFESGNMLLISLRGSDTKLLLSAAQQIAHLFFPSPHEWVHDGLAGYAQVRLIEEKEGRQAAIEYLEAHHKALLELEKQITDGKISNEPLINERDEFRVRTKGMYMWWMLRDMIGQNALDAALHNYKAAEDDSPSYLQKLVEAQARRDLQWFFDDWVYHDRGLPDFRIASVYPSELTTGGYMVTVTVENLGGARAEVPVTLHLQTGEVSQRLMVPAKSKASVRIQTASLPQTATVNDGSVPESDASNNEFKLNH